MGLTIDGKTVATIDGKTPASINGVAFATAPTTPVASVAAGNSSTIISLVSGGTGATSYDIYWGTSTGITTASTKITGVTLPYTHTGLTNGTTYYYKLSAVNSSGHAESTEVSATPAVTTYTFASATGWAGTGAVWNAGGYFNLSGTGADTGAEYCVGAEGYDQDTCEANGGTWVVDPASPPDSLLVHTPTVASYLSSGNTITFDIKIVSKTSGSNIIPHLAVHDGTHAWDSLNDSNITYSSINQSSTSWQTITATLGAPTTAINKLISMNVLGDTLGAAYSINVGIDNIVIPGTWN